MGKKALRAKRATVRSFRAALLSDDEKASLRSRAEYEGSPFHKLKPGDFGLTPPAAPRPDKTLCDEAGVLDRASAAALFEKAIERGLVSDASTANGYPKQMWVVDEAGQVFEAIYGGSREGRYHGYPIRRADPLFDEVSRLWGKA